VLFRSLRPIDARQDGDVAGGVEIGEILPRERVKLDNGFAILLDPRIPRSLQRLAGPQILVGSGDRDLHVREALPDRRDRLEQDVDALLDGVTAGESDDLAVARSEEHTS